ncbi:hypothetical protein M514_22002 [Trichuris suis]|uniref:Galectin domain-containing protein n=1 Tax=Trichuris suis TaxID=68888 RepID=A0A085N8J4_9BILA|nr:hypothetical protein M514_22002 [Trichuris suis]
MEAALSPSFNATYLDFYYGQEDVSFRITGNYSAKLWVIHSQIDKTSVGLAKYEQMKVTAEPERMFATKVVIENGTVELIIDNQRIHFVLPLPVKPITMVVVNGDFTLYKAEARTLSRCLNAEYCLVHTVKNGIEDYVSHIAGKTGMRSLPFPYPIQLPVPSRTLRLTAQVSSVGYQFSILYLRLHSNDDILWHLRVHPFKENIVTAYTLNRKSNVYRNYTMTSPASRGQVFTITAILKDGKVEATINNQVIHDVLPVPFKPITMVSVRGHFALYSINLTTFTTTKDSSEQKKSDGEISKMSEANENHYLGLPYIQHFMKTGKALLLSMQVSLRPNARVTLIDIYSALDIVWHIRGDYANRKWVLNSWINGKWEKDRFEDMKIPTAARRVFNITIKIEDGKVTATIDNQTIEDNVAQRDYPVTSVNVDGDLFLYKVETVVLKDYAVTTERQKARIESFIRERNPLSTELAAKGKNGTVHLNTLRLPYWLPFEQPSVTQFLFVLASLKPNASTTGIDLYVGDAVVWHLKGWYDDELWVLNWKRHSVWQQQRYYKMNIDRTPGRVFNVTVIVNGGYVEARFDNQTIYDMRDLPDKPISGALIHSGFVLYEALVIPMGSDYKPKSDNEEKSTVLHRPTVAELEWTKVKPLSLPFTTKFEEPQYRQILYLQAALKPNPQRTLIQLYANGKLVWYIKGDFKNKTWTLSSQIENDLPVERYRQMEIALDQERIFNVTIALDGMNVKATIDNQTIYDVIDLTAPVTSVTIDGDFTLYEVNTGKIERNSLAMKKHGVPSTGNVEPTTHHKEARDSRQSWLRPTVKEWMMPPPPETKEGSDKYVVFLKLQELPEAKEFEVDLEVADGTVWAIRVDVERKNWTVGSLVKGVWRKKSSGKLKSPLDVEAAFPVKLRLENGTILVLVDDVDNNPKPQLPEKALLRVFVKGDVITHDAHLLRRTNGQLKKHSNLTLCPDARMLEVGEPLTPVAITDDSASSNEAKTVSAIVKLKPEAKRFHMKVLMDDDKAWRLVADLDKDEWNYSTLIDNIWEKRASFKSGVRLTGVFNLRAESDNDSVEFYLDDKKVTPKYPAPGGSAKRVRLSGDVERQLVSVGNLPSSAQSGDIVWHDDDEIEENEEQEKLTTSVLDESSEDNSRISKLDGSVPGISKRDSYGMRSASSVKEWLLSPTPEELKTNDTGREILVKVVPLPEAKHFDLDLEINETVAWTMRVDLEKNTFTCGVLVRGKWQPQFSTALGTPLKVGSASVVKLKLENGTVQAFVNGTVKSPKVPLPGETVHHVALIGDILSDGARSKLFSRSGQQRKDSSKLVYEKAVTSREEVSVSDDVAAWEAAEPLSPILVTSTTESSNVAKTITAVGKLNDKPNLVHVDLQMDSGSASRLELDLTSNDWYFNTFANNVWEKQGPFKSPVPLSAKDVFKLEARIKDGVAELYLNERKLSPSYRLPGKIVQKATMSGDVRSRSVTIENLEWMSETEETIWHFAGEDNKVQSEHRKNRREVSTEQKSSPEVVEDQHHVRAHQLKKFGLLVGIVARFILKPDAKKFYLLMETDDNKLWRIYAPLESKVMPTFCFTS